MVPTQVDLDISPNGERCIFSGWEQQVSIGWLCGECALTPGDDCINDFPTHPLTVRVTTIVSCLLTKNIKLDRGAHFRVVCNRNYLPEAWCATGERTDSQVLEVQPQDQSKLCFFGTRFSPVNANTIIAAGNDCK